MARSTAGVRPGPYTTCYNCFVRWRLAGVCSRIMDAKAAAHDAAVQMIGTSIVRVRQHAACIACNKGQSMAGREEVSPARYMRWSMAAACRSGSHSQRAKRTTAGLPQSSCPALSRDQCCWLTETMMPTAPPVPAGWTHGRYDRPTKLKNFPVWLQAAPSPIKHRKVVAARASYSASDRHFNG